jgi:hypothetical protein
LAIGTVILLHSWYDSRRGGIALSECILLCGNYIDNVSIYFPSRASHELNGSFRRHSTRTTCSVVSRISYNTYTHITYIYITSSALLYLLQNINSVGGDICPGDLTTTGRIFLVVFSLGVSACLWTIHGDDIILEGSGSGLQQPWRVLLSGMGVTILPCLKGSPQSEAVYASIVTGKLHLRMPKRRFLRQIGRSLSVHALASSGDSILTLVRARHLSAGKRLDTVTLRQLWARLLVIYAIVCSQCRRGTTITSAASGGFCRVKEVVQKDTKPA